MAIHITKKVHNGVLTKRNILTIRLGHYNEVCQFIKMTSGMLKLYASLAKI